MKILFVENRQRTGFWDEIALELETDGHEIFWIIQNHLFKPKSGKAFFIPYFRKNKDKINVIEDREIDKIIKADRGLNHNKIKSPDFIYYYNNHIINVLDVIKPDVAFGEATQFHELIVSKECKKRGILFLQPTSCRYPHGRTSFYKYDTLETFAGSGETLNEIEATNIINSICKRTSLPDYMMSPRNITLIDKLVKDRFFILSGYYKGEKFATPHPLIKIKQQFRVSKLLKKWDTLAKQKPSIVANDGFKVLFPLQLQPESSIDVWATDYIDQTSVIKKIHAQLNESDYLLIKLNPRSFLELTDELIDFCFNQANVVMLPSTEIMKTAFDASDLIITINGTVALEAVLANKPSATLSKMITSDEKNSVLLNKIEDIAHVIRQVKMRNFPSLSSLEKVTFINKLNFTSYKGVCGDTLYSRHFLHDKMNMKSIVLAFRDVISKI